MLPDKHNWVHSTLSLEEILQLNVKKMLCIYIKAYADSYYGMDEDCCTMFFLVWYKKDSKYILFTPETHDYNFEDTYAEEQFDKDSCMAITDLCDAKQLEKLVIDCSVMYQNECEITMLVNKHDVTNSDNALHKIVKQMYKDMDGCNDEHDDDDDDSGHDDDDELLRSKDDGELLRSKDDDTEYDNDDLLPGTESFDVDNDFRPITCEKMKDIKCNFVGTTQIYSGKHFSYFKTELLKKLMNKLKQ